MIKPADINPESVVLNPLHLAALEESFDSAIIRARTAGKWPAVVVDDRDTCTVAEVEHVADRYRAEGWKIVTGQRTERALIDHPDRKRS